MEHISIQCSCPICNNQLIITTEVHNLHILNNVPIDTYCNFCLYKKEKEK